MSHGAVGTHGAQAVLLLTLLKPPRASSPAVSLSCPQSHSQWELLQMHSQSSA